MTKPKVMFNPVAQEYFDNPYEIYARMRDDAPLYYDEQEDFYALTRHEDVAAAFKDHDSFSSARGCDLSMVRTGEVPAEVDHLHGPARPSPYAQPAQQGVHTARNPVAEGNRHRADRALPRQGRSGQLRRRAGLLRPVPGGGHHPDGGRARGLPPAGSALDRQELASQAGTDRSGRRQHAGQHRLGRVLLRPRPGAQARIRRTT